jgi:hypothetical protein
MARAASTDALSAGPYPDRSAELNGIPPGGEREGEGISQRLGGRSIFRE